MLKPSVAGASPLIAMQMIIVTSPSKPFQYTGKGSIRRQACIAEYEAEINAAYDAVAQSTQTHIQAPATWDMWNTKDFVRSVVTHVMRDSDGKLKDETELFQAGLDM